jgi:hypothetical protein
MPILMKPRLPIEILAGQYFDVFFCAAFSGLVKIGYIYP